MAIVLIFLSTLILGVPILAVLGLTTIIPLQFNGDIPIIMAAQAVFTGVNQFVLIAVTEFIFAGMIMEKSGITDGLLEFSKEVVGRFTGGYAILTILTSSFFAALTGAGPACTAAVGAITIPLMLRAGYDKSFAASVAAVGGTLGIMIPPSNPMMVYALLAGLSVGDMFIAGIVPGLFTALLLMLVSAFISRKNGYKGINEPFNLKKFFRALWNAKWGVIAPILILGGIYGGIVTPTESAEIAIIYALIIGFLNKRLTMKDVIVALKQTAIMSGSVVSIVGIASAFGRVLTVYRIPQAVGEALLSVSHNPIILQFLIVLVMLFVGMWMEPISSMVILTPIFLPLLRQVGVDPIAFGILMTLSTQMAFITPPVAANLYVVCQLAGISLDDASKQIIPFLLVLVFVVIVIILFPQIATFLPDILAK